MPTLAIDPQDVTEVLTRLFGEFAEAVSEHDFVGGERTAALAIALLEYLNRPAPSFR